jgi:type VI secretion system protein ImpH
MNEPGSTPPADPSPPGSAPAVPRRRAGQPRTLEERLLEESYAFDFYQAVRVLQRLRPESIPVGHGGPPGAESVRFRALCSLSFPPSSIYDIERASPSSMPRLTQAVLGLTGPSGVLPRHYTELLLRIDIEAKGPEKYAFRDWLDLFNHRLVSYFYRAWEKYRFYIPFERGEFAHLEVDPFTRCLLSLVGLGTPHLRDRLAVRSGRPRAVTLTESREDPGDRVLARIEDLSLLYYSGMLAHRPRCALSLQAILRDYFQLEVSVRQFQGQWLALGEANQSRLWNAGWNNRLGVNTVVGEKVWDLQSKIRIKAGPLGYDRFVHFLPNLKDVGRGNAFFLLSQLVRLYVGPELDFDVQVVLRAAEVPECQLSESAPVGPLLGWNTWIRTEPFRADAEEAVFEGNDVYFTGVPEANGHAASPAERRS